jgi:hypothetical protein
MATTLTQIAFDRPRSRAYFTGIAVAFIVIVVAGFSRRYFTQLAGPAPIALVVHLHAAAFAAWFVLVLTQTALVAAGRTDRHRRLGLCAVVLAPLAIVLGALTAIHGARHGWNPGGAFRDPLAFMALGLVDIALFAGFVTAGFFYRHRSEAHKRLMILASVSLLWAAITRLPSFAGERAPEPLELAGLFGLLAAFAFSGPLYDFFSRRRVRALEVAGGALIVGSRPLARTVSTTDAWHAFAGWLVG